MKKRKVRLRFPRQRPVLSDTLPFEVPPSFSNGHFFEFLARHEVEFREDRLQWNCSDDRLDDAIRLVFGVSQSVAISTESVVEWGKAKTVRYISEADCEVITKPYSFKISHKDNEARTLSVCHPRNQVRVADFYNHYNPLMIYYAGLSPFSLRKPSEVAKMSYFKDRLHYENLEVLPLSVVEQDDEEYEQLGTVFRYRRYNNIHKFFESPIYHRAEKKFDAMMQLDVSKCFDSIYTHSISWALIGKQATKDDIGRSRETFGGKFDRLMQQMNDSETNGILVGPEFSRIFAELILQSVDVEVERALMARDPALVHKVDYEMFRYVDDYFVFYNKEEDSRLIIDVVTECLADVKLSVNPSKTAVYRKPIITEITVAKDRISTLFNEELVGVLEKVIPTPAAQVGAEAEAAAEVAPAYSYRVELNANRLIIKFKTILKESGVAYKDILNYSFSIIENKVENIIKHFCLADVDRRSNKQLAKAFSEAIEFVFFLYAASPRVNHTIRACRILGAVSEFLESNAIGAELKHHVYKIIHDNISHHLRKHKVSEFREVESLYLLLALTALGRDYLLGERALADYFGFLTHGSDYQASENCKLSYFSITVALLYMGHKKRYSRLRAAFEAYALTRIEARKGYCGRDTETLLLALDLISCPYVDGSTKIAAGQAYGLDAARVAAVEAANPLWFTTWTGFDLQKELDAKRSRDVY